MKNYKKIIAMLLAATMTMGSTGVVFAGGSEGFGTGEGELDIVKNSNVYDVVLPTATEDTYNFILDPTGVIKASAGEKYGKDLTFKDGVSMFFKNTKLGDSDNDYTDSSDVLEIVNKSSTEVKVDVKATVTDIDTQKLPFVTGVDAFKADDAAIPEIYLALSDTETTNAQTVAISTADSENKAELPQKTLDGAESEYETKWNESAKKYEKVLKENPDDSKFAKYGFKLTGACNTGAAATDAWANLSDIQPKVEVVWKVTVPYETGASVQLNKNGTITVNDPEGQIVSKVKVVVDDVEWAEQKEFVWEDTSYDWTKGGNLDIKMPASWVTAFEKEKSKVVVTVELKDGKTLTQTLQYE